MTTTDTVRVPFPDGGNRRWCRSRPSDRRTPCAGLLALVLLFRIDGAAAQERWPGVIFPKAARPFHIGEQLTANGLPMHLQGFVSDSSPAELLQDFRQSLGKPLVESVASGKRILGRAEGRYYLTVQIESAGSGSKGLVAITDLKGMHESRIESQDQDSRWLRRLPSGSTIASRMASADGGKSAGHLVIVNGHGESLNRDALVSLMGDDGFRLERETTQDDNAAAGMRSHLSNGKVLFFKGEGKDAMAVIVRDAQGRSSIVLNIIAAIEEFK